MTWWLIMLAVVVSWVASGMLDGIGWVFYAATMDRLDRQRMVDEVLAAGPLPGNHMTRPACGFPGHAGLRPEQDQQLHQAMLWSMWRTPI